MRYTFFELIWFFLIYSFIGWIGETVYAAIRHKKFSNRGVLNGPICPIYGVAMVVMLVFFDPLETTDLVDFLFLVVGCISVSVIIEYFAGLILEHATHRKWWDYSNIRFNIGGYVAVPVSCLLGLAAACVIAFIHPAVTAFFERDWSRAVFIISRVVAIALLVLLLIDLACVLLTMGFADRRRRRLEQAGREESTLEQAAAEQVVNTGQKIRTFSLRLTHSITSSIERRMDRAFPTMESVRIRHKKKEKTVFAEGAGFHKLVWLFFIGSFLGDIVEMIFCRIRWGTWMSRSSLVWGQFSVVWGMAIVVMTIMLHRYRDRSDRYLFVFGAIVGGVYEYICSVGTELLFDTVFWDYSDLPFNLGGRINLLYCLFWGLVAVIWIKGLYPILSGWIEKVPIRIGTVISWVIVVFMVVDMAFSAAALYRYSARRAGEEAQYAWEEAMDEWYPDEKMDVIYPMAMSTQE